MINGAENNYKQFQGQEWTEDLGLNIQEWKYRVSDPTIGRFWQVDPLAEDYTYNSTYAFQENKMGMGVELEGLEMTTFQDKDGNNVVNVNYKIVNSTTGDKRLNQSEVIARAEGIGSQFKSSFEGKGADGSNTIVNVSYDYVDSANTENGDYYIDFVDKVTVENHDQLSPELKTQVELASGKVDNVGNTQINRIQVAGKERNSTLRENSITGAHETGHTGNLGHANKPGENTNAVNQGIQNSEFGSRGNLMKSGAVGSQIVPAQRTDLIKTIKKQQYKQH